MLNLACRIFVAVLILYEVGKIQKKVGKEQNPQPTIHM